MAGTIHGWRNKALEVTAKGTIVRKADSLADLHRRRDEAEGQFYTPDWVAGRMWSLLAPVFEGVQASNQRKPVVLDTSVGSGRLLQYADPERHVIYGIDIDQRCVDALSEDASAAGFEFDLECAGMEEVKAKNFDAAIINPPFGLHLEHPQMQPYPCTTFGMFGPNTSAISHLYAVDQALAASRYVVALLPTSAREECFSRRRLWAELNLPIETFKAEGANVRTAIYVFGPNKPASEPQSLDVTTERDWPSLFTGTETTYGYDRPRLTVGGVDVSEPTIHTPVTHDTRVELHHHRRSIKLKFACGLTEAKVLNALLREPVEPVEGQRRGSLKHRYPDSIQFKGDGQLMLDAYLLQDDPQEGFNGLLDEIRKAGGMPQVSPTLSGYWEKLKRKHVRASTPFRHTIKASTVGKLELTAKRGMLLEQGNVKSPAIRKGEKVQAEPMGGDYLLEKDGFRVQYRRDQLQRLFNFAGGEDERSSTEWQVVHEGLCVAFPNLAHQYREQILAAGIDWLWPYQLEGLIELLITPYGCISAWEQGTGKARLSLALALMSGRGLICVESGLVPEMVREIQKIGLPSDQWKTIDCLADTQELRAINIISYNRLKAVVKGKRQTIAYHLRRRARVVIADEGGILSNPGSQQSRALLQLAARKLYILDGTPCGNYPRDILPLAAASAGGSRAHQPYGIRSGVFMEPRLLTSAQAASRGIDVFRERHVSLEWATNEFKDDLRGGAKREIPKINNVVQFRGWVAPFIQRRLRNEPEVEPFAGCPDPEKGTVTLNWDKEHLRHYLTPAVDFARWFETHKKERNMEGKGSNLVAVLARINAVIQAANAPHAHDAGVGKCYTPLTSKQRWTIDRLEQLSAQGKKTIVYASSPETLERLQKALADRGIEGVIFTGKGSIKARTERLDNRFRFGPAPVLLASLGVSQRGLNLPQASHIIFYNRDWTADAEAQAIARTTRPDQEATVQVEFAHLRGSIDEYMAQVVEWKQAAADSGLDWGDGATESDVFQHMDAVLEAFCHEVLEMSSRETYETLCAA
jgi:hypothetical protein